MNNSTFGTFPAGTRDLFTMQAYFVNTLDNFTLDKRGFLCYIITMKVILISPTKKAKQRTKNRIREHGPQFEFVNETGSNWLLKAGKWFGWLPRNEFNIECVGKEFVKKVRG